MAQVKAKVSGGTAAGGGDALVAAAETLIVRGKEQGYQW